MAKCKNCDKTGLLLRVNKEGLCKDCAEKKYTETIREELINTNNEFASLNAELEKQGDQIRRINAAREKLDDLELLRVYEDVFIKEKSTMNSQGHRLALADLYIKYEQYNNAWSYLNSLITEIPDQTEKIRIAQVKILKKEEKFQQALEFLMMGHLKRSEWTKNFDSKKFEKEARPIIKKIAIPNEKEADLLGYTSYLIDSQVKAENFSERKLIEAYRKMLDDVGLR